MPKVTRPGAPKKSRWTAAQKAAAKKRPQRAPGQRPGAPAQTTERAPQRRGAPDPRAARAERPLRGARPEKFDQAGPGDRARRPERSAMPERQWAPAGDRARRPERSAMPERQWAPAGERGRRPERSATPERQWAPAGERGRRPERTATPERTWAPAAERGRAEWPRPDRSRAADQAPRQRDSSQRDLPEAGRPDWGRTDRGRSDWGRTDGGRPERRGPGARPSRERPAYRAPVDPERERIAADEWTSSARKSLSDKPVDVAADNAFGALGLPPRLVERLARDGITEPFPIQAATIPDTLAGRDVLGRGQTGSGKTLAFGLPVLARLADPPTPRAPRQPRALVLVPTRELAMQVTDALEPLVHVLGLRHKLVAGGLSYTTQIAALARGVDLLVATPGRLLDLLERGAVTLDAVTVLVLDEADHMAEMGFLPEVTAILDQVPDGGQRLLFSATLDNGVDDLVRRYLTEPVTHSTDAPTASVSTMRHLPLLVDPHDKKGMTAALATRPGRTLLFVRTKLGADRVAAQLREAGVVAAALHGGLSQGVRNRVLGAFRKGTVPVLVATDVAARGIHVDDVSLIVQVDPPADHKDYLHRAGRTARAGELGSVVTLVLPHQRKMMERMLREAGLQQTPTRVGLDDPVVASVGGAIPSGPPLDEAAFARLLEPPPARGPGGARGPRHGSRGGFRPHHGAAAGSGPRAATGRMSH